MQPIGLLTLNAQPDELLRRDRAGRLPLGHLVPGIEVTDDPLLQARLFSYLDTQLTRLGGPNFAQIPINRPHAPVNDMLRDGMHQPPCTPGVAPYQPNSLDGGCPFHAGAGTSGRTSSVPRAGRRRRPRCARRPRRSTTTTARRAVLAEHDAGRAGAHRAGVHLRARQVLRADDQGAQLLAWPTSTPSCAPQVAAGLGLPAPAPTRAARPTRAEPGAVPAGRDLAGRRTDGRHRRRRRRRPGRRRGGSRAGPGSRHGPAGGRPARRDAAARAGRGPAHLRHRPLRRVRRGPRSPGRPRPAPDAFAARASKAGAAGHRRRSTRGSRCCSRRRSGTPRRIGAWGEGRAVLEGAGITGAGVVTGEDAVQVLDQLRELLGAHRIWERFTTST